MNETFTVTFEEWSEETGENTCDFCDEEQVKYWCEFLCLGYCEKCMKEQKKQYEKDLKELDEEAKKLIRDSYVSMALYKGDEQ